MVLKSPPKTLLPLLWSAMVSRRQLLESVEAALLAGPKLRPHQRAEVLHLLHHCLPSFQNFLHYPSPKPSDRAQVQTKEVVLPDAAATILDDQDVQIAMKLSDDLQLNEIDCVSLLVTTHQEWGLVGREPLEILRLAAGLWFTERRALITTLQLLLRAVVLDEEVESDFAVQIRQYLEELLRSGLRQQIISLIKELKHEVLVSDSAPGFEPYVIDARGALVLRRNVIQRERLSLCQCLVFSYLILRMSSEEAKSLYSLLREYSSDLSEYPEAVKLQIAYTLTFAILISFISDALSGGSEMPSILAPEAAFRQEFQRQVMETGIGEHGEGFLSVIRLIWAVFMMLTSTNPVNVLPSVSFSSADSSSIQQCLDLACEQNAFKFLLIHILRAPAYQNDDEDMLFIYYGYLHKLLVSFLSQPLGRDKIKDLRDLALVSLEPYYYDSTYSSMDDDIKVQEQVIQKEAQPFVSLMELIAEVYQHVPELTLENDILWNFVRFASEDHTNHWTLVAFLNLVSALASNEEGARKVYQLLQSKTSRCIGWQTLFKSLEVYEEQFKQCLQSTGELLPPFQEGDARALEAYLSVLRKVMENGNKIERLQWFTDIEPLFKLLSYENVPPYLKGALRNTILTFVNLLPGMNDKVWMLLESYDLPLAVGTSVGGDGRHLHSQVYDMSFELNEVEARREEYPSTLSYLKLLNYLIENEADKSDKGQRFASIFRFIRDQVFASYAQRAYADLGEKWQLVCACLQHFQMMLTMYNFTEEDIRSNVDQLPQLAGGNPLALSVLGGSGQGAQVPAIELMKDFMSGKTVFRNVMSIISIGVNTVLEERVNQVHGQHLESAVRLSLELLISALNKDAVFVVAWRPIYQPIEGVLASDKKYIPCLLEYIRYDPSPSLQQCSIKILNILSGRMPQLVSIIQEAGIPECLVEDYAACLEARSRDAFVPENVQEDTGFLILQLLLNNLDRPAPNITHLLLKFDVNVAVEKTILEPKRHYSCLRVILGFLETLARADENAILYELGFQLFYELCVDAVTSSATTELLRTGKYDFFVKHLDTFASDPLPLRKSNHALRKSSLHQRAWLLRLLAVSLHISDMDLITHRESCLHLLSRLFLQDSASNSLVSAKLDCSPLDGLQKMKALELLDIIKFQAVGMLMDFPGELELINDELKVDDILKRDATVEEGGVYYISERGDRLIDLTAFRDKLWQEYKRVDARYGLSFNELRQKDLRDALQLWIRWGWKYNKNIEEQAAQLHMLVGWSQLVEVGVSQRFDLLGHRSQLLFELLDACLSATISPDCSLKMALTLYQVVMTSMAKLHEDSFTPAESSDEVTYLDLLLSYRLSISACQTIFSKLTSSIIRSDSSETLRRRQYATLLLYISYCRGMIDSDASFSFVHSLLLKGHDGDEAIMLENIEREHADLAKINFSIIKNNAAHLFDVVVKDALHGSESGKAVAFYVLDALLGIDQNQFFLSLLQSRGLLQSCLSDVSNNSYEVVLLPSQASLRRLYTLEAELAILLRVGYQYKKRGSQILFGLGVLHHLIFCKAVDVQLTEDAKWEQVVKTGTGLPSQIDRQHQIVSPVLRLVLCLTCLIDTSDPLEKDSTDIITEILNFIKAHQGLVGRILRDDNTKVQVMDLEELQLLTSILGKVWPFEELDDLSIRQALFNLAYSYFCQDKQPQNRYIPYIRNAERMPNLAPGLHEVVQNLELLVAQVRGNIIAYIHTLVAKRGVRLHVSKQDVITEGLSSGSYTLGRQRQPTLKLIAGLLEQATLDLGSSLEEIALLSAKIQDVNELSRHEVDGIIKAYGRQDHGHAGDSIRKRRYLAMVEMCSAAGTRERLVSLLHCIIEKALNILYIHFESKFQVPDNWKQNLETSADPETCFGTKDEICDLSEKLLPVLQRLELLCEERAAHKLHLLQRPVRSLKSHIMLMITHE